MISARINITKRCKNRAFFNQSKKKPGKIYSARMRRAAMQQDHYSKECENGFKPGHEGRRNPEHSEMLNDIDDNCPDAIGFHSNTDSEVHPASQYSTTRGNDGKKERDRPDHEGDQRCQNLTTV